MKPITDIEKLATIYIISKGRPQCKTAQTLTKMEYPGPWFIVCGNNDETIPEYKKRWGEDRVLVFDWYEQIKHTDVMDNFGFDSMPSGAAPARNAVFEFSRQRGELRHWQMDDDFTSFRLAGTDARHAYKMTGEVFYWWLARISRYGQDAGLANVGIALAQDAFPQLAKTFYPRVFAGHNMSNDPAITPEWRGRFNDDTIHAVNVHRLGQHKEMQLICISINTPNTQQEKGGLTEMYQALGTVRKTAYLILAAPNAAKLKIRFGRYHHIVRWDKLIVKTISDKWQRK